MLFQNPSENRNPLEIPDTFPACTAAAKLPALAQVDTLEAEPDDIAYYLFLFRISPGCLDPDLATIRGRATGF